MNYIVNNINKKEELINIIIRIEYCVFNILKIS